MRELTRSSGCRSAQSVSGASLVHLSAVKLLSLSRQAIIGNLSHSVEHVHSVTAEHIGTLMLCLFVDVCVCARATVRLLEIVSRKHAILFADADVSADDVDDGERVDAYNDVLDAITRLLDVALYESRSHNPV
jgi:hypothetical protein